MIPVIDFDHRRQRLAFIRTHTIGNDLSRFFLDPIDAVSGNRMTNLVSAIRRCVCRELLPAGAEDVPHVEYAADDLHEAIANQAGLMQRCRQHRPVADALEGEAIIAADGQTNGGIDGY